MAALIISVKNINEARYGQLEGDSYRMLACLRVLLVYVLFCLFYAPAYLLVFPWACSLVCLLCACVVEAIKHECLNTYMHLRLYDCGLCAHASVLAILAMCWFIRMLVWLTAEGVLIGLLTAWKRG